MIRRRWLYTQGGRPLPEPIEVSTDWENPAPSRTPVVVDLYMDGLAASDGTDIGSRRKRREYMKARGLVDADDFKGQWAKAQQEREAMRTGNHDQAARREAIARALYQCERKKGHR